LAFPTYKKRGNVIVDTILVLIVLTIIAIVSILFYKVQYDINEDIQNDTNMSAYSRSVSQNNTDRFPSLFDNIFLFLFVMFWILVLVSSALTDTSYIFLVVTVIILVLILLLGGVVSNAYEELRTDSDLVSYGDQFPLTNFIMEHLAIFLLFIGGSITLVMFAKKRL